MAIEALNAAMEKQRQEHARAMQATLAEHKREMDQTNAHHHAIVEGLNNDNRTLRLQKEAEITELRAEFEQRRNALQNEINVLNGQLFEERRVIQMHVTTITELNAVLLKRHDRE